MKKILSLLFALILLLCGCSGKDGKKGRGQKYVFPPSDAFSAEITAKQGDFTFSGLLTFSSESGLTLSYSEPSDIAGITVSLKDDTATVTCPEMEPVTLKLPPSSAMFFRGFWRKEDLRQNLQKGCLKVHLLLWMRR